jgi:hypothetical protein
MTVGEVGPVGHDQANQTVVAGASHHELGQYRLPERVCPLFGARGGTSKAPAHSELPGDLGRPQGAVVLGDQRAEIDVPPSEGRDPQRLVGAPPAGASISIGGS